MTRILVIATTIYLIAIAIEDLREREIYVFPCYVLTGLWIELNLYSAYESWSAFIVYGIVCLLLAKILDYKRIWGSGDSDLFFLFTIIFQIYQRNCFTLECLCMEAILFALALMIAFAIACMEAKIRKQKLDKSSSIALAPGFAIVLFTLMWKGVIGC